MHFSYGPLTRINCYWFILFVAFVLVFDIKIAISLIDLINCFSEIPSTNNVLTFINFKLLTQVSGKISCSINITMISIRAWCIAFLNILFVIRIVELHYYNIILQTSRKYLNVFVRTVWIMILLYLQSSLLINFWLCKQFVAYNSNL